MEMSTVSAFRIAPLLMNVPWKLVVSPFKAYRTEVAENLVPVS